ncbi:MAG TPA: ABC transporter ATP-binding protein [Bacteroidia bacterium]|jgi:lipopolysaccharide transport system ATP-binding protein|nr:ABC transporter ATP-binding protein [Bacteroidia bacterium]
MSNVVISIEHLGKQYRLGKVGASSISSDINRLWHIVRGKGDPYLAMGDVNDRTKIGGSEFVWALKDINLEVMKGDVLGIVGKNGAGKSTLLKILSRITSPSVGSFKLKGRIASLLEVGTGFHPDLSGRENIFLNGAILGMTRREVRSKLDEIIDFSGVEKYLETPVKRYSSGMYVRLAFAVAAHLDPEILVIDEVLAVGDAEFQKKCLGKMQEASEKEGRTVLFVSHNLTSVASLCNKVAYIKQGMLKSVGKPMDIISEYLSEEKLFTSNIRFSEDEMPGNSVVRLRGASIINKKKDVIDRLMYKDEFGIEVEFEILKESITPIPAVGIHTIKGDYVLSSIVDLPQHCQPGIYRSIAWIPNNLLNLGTYTASAVMSTLNPLEVHYNHKEFLTFEVIEDMSERNIELYRKFPGIVHPKLNWETYSL